MAGATDGFFSELPVLRRFEDLAEPGAYRPAPASWSVLLTDVRDSTRAIEAGRYRDVNALGVASIVAVRNALPELDLPFVFGGDGATLLAPGDRAPVFEPALRGLTRLAASATGLELRAGVVPVADLYRAGHAVQVARFCPGGHAAFALVAGGGLAEAERWLKDEGRAYRVASEGPEALDLTGLECRWRPIPSRHGVMLSILARARAPEASHALATYRELLSDLARVVASPDAGRPVAAETLRLLATPDAEIRLRSGLEGPLAAARSTLLTAAGRVLLRTGLAAGGFDGGRYLDDVVLQTDFRKFDDMLRMVVDVTPDERAGIEAILEQHRGAGRLDFGLHASREALLTCAVRSFEDDHVHFVDGADGGYALAARQLKASLRAGPTVPA